MFLEKIESGERCRLRMAPRSEGRGHASLAFARRQPPDTKSLGIDHRLISGTTYRAYRREVIRDVLLLGENHRFVPVFAKVAGARIDEIPIRNIERPHGASNYGISRTINVFIDLFFLYFFVRYFDRPIRIFGKIALATFAAGFAITLGLFVLWIDSGEAVVESEAGGSFRL